MTARKLNLSREQLSKFLTDQQQIRQFELLFSILDELANQNVDAGKVYAGPASGTSSPASFRPLVKGDLPAKALTKADDTNVTLTVTGDAATALLSALHVAVGWAGQLSASRGGTGHASYAENELLIGNAGGGLDKATLTAGANIQITNAGGAVTIAVTGLGTMAAKNIGATGSFVAGAQTITVVDGIITAIV